MWMWLICVPVLATVAAVAVSGYNYIRQYDD